MCEVLIGEIKNFNIKHDWQTSNAQSVTILSSQTTGRNKQPLTQQVYTSSTLSNESAGLRIGMSVCRPTPEKKNTTMAIIF